MIFFNRYGDDDLGEGNPLAMEVMFWKGMKLNGICVMCDVCFECAMQMHGYIWCLW